MVSSYWLQSPADIFDFTSLKITSDFRLQIEITSNFNNTQSMRIFTN